MRKTCNVPGFARGLGFCAPVAAPMSDRQVAEFLDVFSLEGRAFTLAMDGGLRTSSIRGLVWRHFLGVATGPTETWPAQLEEHKAQYELHHEKYCADPSTAADGLDLSLSNPLSVDESSPWSAYFETRALREEIDKDLSRLHPGIDFYARPDVQRSMLSILVVWAMINPELSYRQGMHELLAPLVKVTLQEAEEAASALAADGAAGTHCPSVVRRLLSLDAAEAASWALFSALMRTMRPWFEPGRVVPEAGKRPSPLQTTCTHIHDTLLRRVDPELHRRLGALQIEPQLYLLRWLRLLFGREFHEEDVRLVWDAVLAYGCSGDVCELGGTLTLPGGTLTLPGYFCVAMLLYVRETLMAHDFAAVMKRLQKFPPVEDIHRLVKRALHLSQADATAANGLPPLAQASQPASRPPVPLAAGSAIEPPLSSLREALPAAASSLRPAAGGGSDAPMAGAALAQKLAGVADRMASPLSSIATGLHCRPAAGSEEHRALLAALEELQACRGALLQLGDELATSSKVKFGL